MLVATPAVIDGGWTVKLARIGGTAVRLIFAGASSARSAILAAPALLGIGGAIIGGSGRIRSSSFRNTTGAGHGSCSQYSTSRGEPSESIRSNTALGTTLTSVALSTTG